MMDEGLRKKFLREEYIARINRVVDYIELNLDGGLFLEPLARVAGFSPFHFHRIFRAITGEPLTRFIQRLRLEKAATQLIVNPRKPVTRIALDCGFGASASFTRAFREHFSLTPSEWREAVYGGKSKIGIQEGKDRTRNRNIGKAKSLPRVYIDRAAQKNMRRNAIMEMEKSGLELSVEVRNLPAMNVAYVRHIGPYKGDGALFGDLLGRLFAWAGARDLMRFPVTKVFSAYHDNPDVTDEDRLRTSVCITVPENTPVDGEIGTMKLPAARYAVARFELMESQFQEAWDLVYGQWLPGSGYQPDDGPALEFYHNDPSRHPEGKHVVEICVPVKPL